MKTLITTLGLLAVTGCDISIDACSYDDDGTPPLIVSQCFRVGLPQTDHPELPDTLDVSCGDWCTEQGMIGVYTMTYESPDVCAPVDSPVWEIDGPGAAVHGMSRCVCSL